MIKIEEKRLRKILDKELRKHLYTPIGSSLLVTQQTERAIGEFINNVCHTASSKGVE